jgi:hypothetical protein
VLLEDLPSWMYISSFDLELQQIFKAILHLPTSTSTGFLYARKRDGGLGLPRLAHLVFLAYLRAGADLSMMEYPLVPEITGSDYFQSKMNNISASTSRP